MSKSIFSSGDNSNISPNIFAKKYKHPKGSATLNAAAAARALKTDFGADIISLTLGQPDGDPIVKTPSCDVDNKYAPVQGKPELRAKIAEFESKVRGVEFHTDNIHLTNGGKQALDNIFQVFLNPQDVVIAPDVKWVSYSAQINDCEAELVNIETNNTGLISPDHFASALASHNPKMALVNSPSNPTGNVYSQQERESIMKVALDHLQRDPNFILLSDDIYKTIVLSSEYLTHSIFDNSEIKIVKNESELLSHGNLVYVDGFAKGFKAMGWRVGYVVAHPEVIERVKARQGNVCSGISNASQQMALDALDYVFDNPKYFAENNKIFKTRRDYFLPEIKKIDLFEVVGDPAAAFYIFANVSKFYGLKIPAEITDASGSVLKVEHVDDESSSLRGGNSLYLPEIISNAQQLANYLLYVAHVGTVAQNKDFIRFSYAADIKRLEKAIERIKAALAQLV